MRKRVTGKFRDLYRIYWEGTKTASMETFNLRKAEGFIKTYPHKNGSIIRKRIFIKDEKNK